jgi:amino acid adenylation domain-containing protein
VVIRGIGSMKVAKKEHSTLIDLLNCSLSQYPDKIILQDGDFYFSNSFLTRKSDQITNELLKYIDSPEVIIPLIADSSIFISLGIISILKAGASFLLIEPETPADRVRYILEEINPKIIIIQNHLANNFCHYSDKLLIIDNEILNSDITIDNIEQIKPSSLDIDADNIACLIYTSGTTGNPKGVLITHRAIINRLRWMWDKYPREETDVTLQKTSINFVDFIFELFVPLLQGNKISILKHKITEYIQLNNVIERDNVTDLVIVPSVLEKLIEVNQFDFLKNLKRLYISGEKINSNILNKIREFNQRLLIVNLYGSSEVTADATYDEVPLMISKNYSVGLPISNTEIFVLDANLEKKEINESGDIYITGECLARGYHNNPKLTAENFIANPFFKAHQSSLFLRLYSTGDKGMIDTNGNLIFVGRSDYQVKIAGERIELEEVARIIEQYPSIKKAIALLTERNSVKYLVAYYIRNVEFFTFDILSYMNFWNTLYQQEYSSLDIYDKSHDIGVWRSSYTSEPIPQTDMEEWVNSALSYIKNLDPKIILEIGCGSGLILSRLINLTEHYYATDFSEKSISYIQNLYGNSSESSKLTAWVSEADKIDFGKIHNFDTVIINSVVQYFPNIKYLNTLIQQIIKYVDKSAKIFIGDIRDYSLLECFHHSVLQYKGVKLDKNIVSYFSDREKELLIDPLYFASLVEMNYVKYVEILPKNGIADNEMNNYRYDVIIHIEKTIVPDEFIIEVNSSLFKKISNLHDNFFSNKNDEYIYIKYTNKRIYEHFLNYVNSGTYSSNFNNEIIFSIQEIIALAKLSGYHTKFYLDIDDSTQLNIIFYKNIGSKFNIVYNKKSSLKTLSNNPVENMKFFDNDFSEKLRAFLKTKLSENAIPSYFIPIKEFPTSINGKIDRQRLQKPVFGSNGFIIKPKNYIEKQVAKICANVLGISEDLISIGDNFFSLGGNSLLAIKFAHSLGKEFKIDLGVADVVKYKSLDNIAELIDGIIFNKGELFEEEGLL